MSRPEADLIEWRGRTAKPPDQCDEVRQELVRNLDLTKLAEDRGLVLVVPLWTCRR